MKVKGNLYTPPHREIMLTFRGEAPHALNQKVYLRQPGVVMLFDRHEARDLHSAPHKRSFHCLWLHLSNRESLTCNSNSCDARGRYFQEIAPHVRTGDAVRTLMDAWDHCVAHGGKGFGWELLRAQATALLLEILGSAPAQTGQGEPHAQVIASVEEYIHQHLEEDLSLRSLARVAGYSPFFFHRLFVRHLGSTPGEYVNAARLEKARELLWAGYTVQAVAESVGLASTSYFNHFFKQRTGFSPRAWAVRKKPTPPLTDGGPTPKPAAPARGSGRAVRGRPPRG